MIQSRGGQAIFHKLTSLLLAALHPVAVQAEACTENYIPTPPGYQFTASLDRWGQSNVDHGLDGPARVGNVYVNSQPIFNLMDEDENNAIYRWVNRFHRKTRPDVIRKLVLFEQGTVIDEDLLQESERILRNQSFTSDAAIKVVSRCENVVDLEIIQKEVWTLLPDLKLKTGGGVSEVGLGFHDANFLGSGNRVGANYNSDPERDSLSFQFVGQNLLDSRLRLGLQVEDNSDGHQRLISLSHPFYAIKTERAWGLFLNDEVWEQIFYRYGDEANRLEIKLAEADFWLGRGRPTDDGVMRRRFGIHYEDTQYLEGNLPRRPGDRTLFYPYVEWQKIEDEYGVAYNINQINRAEDLHFGRNFRARFGYSASGNRRFIIAGDFVDTLTSQNKQLLQAGINWRGRWNFDENSLEGAMVSLNVDYHRGQTPTRSLYLGVRLTRQWRPDPEDTLLLGGIQGLRGYPANFVSGVATYRFTAEQRIFTDLNPLSLFNVGFVAFFDAGRASPGDLGTDDGWLSDVGFGIRLVPDKTDRDRVIHIDVGYPLRKLEGATGPQFLVEVKQTL